MKLRRRDARPATETIVALIDVVFFLLIFFMLVGRMDATSPFDVIPPRTQAGADMPGGGITVTVATDGRLALDGKESERDPALADLFVRLKADPGLLVRVNAHRDARLGDVLPLVAEIERLGAGRIIFVVTPEAL